jgi:hypothetical protein
MANKGDFEIVFLRLKAILEPYAPRLIMAADTRTNYSLETPHLLKNKHRLFFAGVRLGKAYVSFYLMPAYAAGDISPELQKRMQGKACFNFAAVDEKLLKELAKLTKTGLAKFTDKKFLQGLQQP